VSRLEPNAVDDALMATTTVVILAIVGFGAVALVVHVPWTGVGIAAVIVTFVGFYRYYRRGSAS
jgi:hypothetical protein